MELCIELPPLPKSESRDDRVAPSPVADDASHRAWGARTLYVAPARHRRRPRMVVPTLLALLLVAGAALHGGLRAAHGDGSVTFLMPDTALANTPEVVDEYEPAPASGYEIDGSDTPAMASATVTGPAATLPDAAAGASAAQEAVPDTAIELLRTYDAAETAHAIEPPIRITITRRRPAPLSATNGAPDGESPTRFGEAFDPAVTVARPDASMGG